VAATEYGPLVGCDMACGLEYQYRAASSLMTLSDSQECVKM